MTFGRMTFGRKYIGSKGHLVELAFGRMTVEHFDDTALEIINRKLILHGTYLRAKTDSDVISYFEFSSK